MSPSLRLPVENNETLTNNNYNNGQAAADASGVIRMCEENFDRQSDSLDNTEMKNFFNNNDEEDDIDDEEEV